MSSRRSSSSSLLLRRLLILALPVVLLGAGALAWHRKTQITRSGGAESNPILDQADREATSQKCDVAVVGGTPSGVAAALAAARAGAKVVLVEPRPLLGGDITYAWINQFDVPIKGVHSAHSPVDYGIFSEFYRKLGLAFPPEQARDLIEEKIKKEPNIQVLTSTSVARLGLSDGKLSSALLHVGGVKWVRLQAPAWVDATNDGDIAARAGAGFMIGREGTNPDRAMQAAGLFFKLKNVDWDKLWDYVTSTREISADHALAQKPGAKISTDMKFRGNKVILRLGGGHGPYAWERGDIAKGYVPHGPNIEVLSINFGRTSEHEVVLNCLNILGVNGLTKWSRTQAITEARAELPFLVAYLKAEMPGLENAELAGAAPELYIRETRHISGLTKINGDDVQDAKVFPDRIALCAYSMDLHPYKKGEKIKSGTRRWVFTLPLSALVPKRVDGVFVASRSLSATYSAAGAARVIPITMAAGQAAGLCAALCVQNGVSPHEFAGDANRITQLQEQLRKDGVDIGDNAPALAQAAKPKPSG